MALTINTKTYTLSSVGQNLAVYFGPGKTFSTKDDLVLSITAPVPTPVNSGVAHASAKLQRGVPLTGAVATTGIARVTVTVDAPVGTSTADIDAILNDAGAYVSSASFKSQVKNSALNH